MAAVPLASAGFDRNGLSSEEAAARLRREGENALPIGRRRGLLALLVDVVSEPMILLLVAAALVYLALGEIRDALLITGSVGGIIALELFQGTKAETALEALRSLSEPSAEVVRDGVHRTIPHRAVVRGDLLVLAEGRRVVADARVVEQDALEVDESLLTGESMPVPKRVAVAPVEMTRPGGETSPFVYSQTLVVRGRGLAVAEATGPRTEVSRIAHALVTVEPETPLLRKQTRRLLFGTAAAGVLLCATVALLTGIHTGQWAAGLLAGIALAIAMVPEEIPVVLSVYSALGARRIAENKVLTRRFESIGTLGATTVLCTDKTGTVTENRMRVGLLETDPSVPAELGNPPVPRSPADSALLGDAALACEPHPTDPMEVAILDLGRSSGVYPPAEERRAVRSFPIGPTLLAVGYAYRAASGAGYDVLIKGAPEAVLSLCEMGAAERAAWEARIERASSNTLRLIGVARGSWSGAEPPERLSDCRFAIRGVIGLHDPIRAGVVQAMADCRTAGIRVVLITGDHPGTARSVAREAGIANPERVAVGDEIARLPDPELRETARNVNVFARVRPEEKLRLVRALQGGGDVVAMTGDGVNDAPALKAAHVGVAMGGRGTDVAREAASLVLLDDSFPTLVSAIRLGRRIYDNMRKAFRYILAIHVAIAGMALFPVVFGLPLVLFPIEIVFLEFVIDPTVALVFEAEPEEPDVMERPPRDPKESIGTARLISSSIGQGFAVLVAVFGLYFFFLRSGLSAEVARSLAFASLLTGNLLLMLVHRSDTRPFWELARARNPYLYTMLLWGFVILLLSLYVAPVSGVFHFTRPPLGALALALLVSAASVLWIEPVKLLLRSRSRHRSPASAPG